MILPILAYGSIELRRKCEDINEDFPNIRELINDMYETSDGAYGVGLSAPQIGKNINLFVIDTTKLERKKTDPDYEILKTFKSAFINPKIISITGKNTDYDEGCLSFPEIFQNIVRQDEVEIEYYDENFKLHRKKFKGFISRVIQHEYDHLEGKLFIDKISLFKRNLLKSKLERIKKGNIKLDYKMQFAIK